MSTRRLRARAAWAIALGCCLTAGTSSATRKRYLDQVVLLTANFSSPAAPELSTGVATYYNLQVWTTLRSTDGHGSFGHGLIESADSLAAPTSHEDAEVVAKKTIEEKDAISQIVMWGSVQTYGGKDQVVVTTFLTLPELADKRPSHPEVWELRKTAGGQTFHFRLDVPSRRYELQPVLVTASAMRYYGGDGWRAMHERPTLSSKVVGQAIDLVTAVSSQPPWVLAYNKRREDAHWLYLLPLGTDRDPAVDLGSGLVRIFRGDWDGAEELLANVSANSDVPVKVRRDVLTYRLMAAARRRPGPRRSAAPTAEALYQAATKLDPDAPTVTRYELMRQLARLPETLPSRTTPAVDAVLSAIEPLLGDMGRKNAADDPLATEARKLLATARQVPR